jgi:hypothetical protein
VANTPTDVALQLFRDADTTPERAAGWILAGLAKVARDTPGMTVGALVDLMAESMPQAAAAIRPRKTRQETCA